MRLGWVTDVHLNFLSSKERTGFYDRLGAEVLDALLLGGDIGEADSVTTFLAEMEDALRIPIYFVLGNHDFYGSSIESVRQIVARQSAASSWLNWLTATEIVALTANTALVGHDSWADGRLGDFFRSDVMMNDHVLISDLRGLSRRELYAKLNALGDEAATFLERRVLATLPHYQTVIVLTHVPPFRESCWHEGRISTDEFLPHFACRIVGDRLAAIMSANPNRNMQVLCGHTHSPGFARILDNLVVHTAAHTATAANEQ